MPPLFPRPPPPTQMIPCKANLQVLQMFNSWMSLSCYPTHQGTVTVSFICPLDLHVSSFHNLAFWLTDASFDGINTKVDATNMLVAHTCSYTPMQSLSSSPPNFESINVAFTVPDTSRRYAPESSQFPHIELTCYPTSHSESPLFSASSSSSV